MSVNDKDIALAHDSDSLQWLATQGYNNHTYEFSWKGEDYIVKEMKMHAMDYRRLGYSPTKVAAAYNIAQNIAKKYFGDNLVESNYLVALSRDGEPTVVTVQPKIEGEALFQVVGRGEMSKFEAEKIVDDYHKKWEEMKADSRWFKLPKEVRSWFTISDFDAPGNIIATPDKRYIIVDF